MSRETLDESAQIQIPDPACKIQPSTEFSRIPISAEGLVRMVTFTTNSVLWVSCSFLTLPGGFSSFLGRHLKLRDRGNFDITDKRSGLQESWPLFCAPLTAPMRDQYCSNQGKHASPEISAANAGSSADRARTRNTPETKKRQPITVGAFRRFWTLRPGI